MIELAISMRLNCPKLRVEVMLPRKYYLAGSSAWLQSTVFSRSLLPNHLLVYSHMLPARIQYKKRFNALENKVQNSSAVPDCDKLSSVWNWKLLMSQDELGRAWSRCMFPIDLCSNDNHLANTLNKSC